MDVELSKPGDELEKLVEIIERSISPDAEIEQNVFLPNLTSPEGHTAQCDIVIRQGKPPRQTLTIVEVQDRTSKVDINTFRGWLGKLEDVGAQHLLCVSRQDFPSSIKEKVSQLGTKVLLVTIKEKSPEKIPIGLIDFKFLYRNVNIKSVSNLKQMVPQGAIEKHNLKPSQHSFRDKLWSLDKKSLISIVKICESEIYSKQLSNIKDSEGTFFGVDSVHYELDDTPGLYFFADDNFIQIGLKCDFEWELEQVTKPMTVASYEQDNHGALAWVFEVNHLTTDGNISIKLPVVENEHGRYDILQSVVESPTEYDLKIIPRHI